eukprot:10983001-Heterocapsa_arctica.AAC.1
MGLGPPRVACRRGPPGLPCTPPPRSQQPWPACAARAGRGPRFGPRLQAEESHTRPPGSPSWDHVPRRAG